MNNAKQEHTGAKSAKSNKSWREFYNNLLNTSFACRYIIEVSREDSTYTHSAECREVTYGFSEIAFWIPSLQRWVTSDASKFQVTADTFELAKSEFWARFNKYCVRRFGNVKIYMERSHSHNEVISSNAPHFNSPSSVRRTETYTA